MNEEKVLTLRGKRAVWAPGGGTGPIDPKRLPEGYPYKEQISIDWDGNTDGLVATTGSPSLTLYKISDTLYDVGAITGFNYTMGNGETSETHNETPGLLGSGNAWTSSGNMVWCCLTENYTMSSYGITFPEPGLYVMGNPYFWIENVSFDILHPMTEEFMPLLTSPNGTKYKLTVSDDGTLSAVAVS